MKVEVFSHNRGASTVPRWMQNGIERHLQKTDFEFAPRTSVRLRHLITKRLHLDGWSGRVRLGVDSSISITSMNKGVALCLQTGNMSRFYADILKIQLLKRRRRIKAAIYIIPTTSAAKRLGSNVACYERFIEELRLFEKIITTPMLVFGIR